VGDLWALGCNVSAILGRFMNHPWIIYEPADQEGVDSKGLPRVQIKHGKGGRHPNALFRPT